MMKQNGVAFLLAPVYSSSLISSSEKTILPTYRLGTAVIKIDLGATYLDNVILRRAADACSGSGAGLYCIGLCLAPKLPEQSRQSTTEEISKGNLEVHTCAD